MFTSFSTALSALQAQATAIDVVGNNLANLSTSGFKGSVVAFHDLVSQSLGSGEIQIGFGVGRPVTLRHFTQGSIQVTTGALDAAIQGDGFFLVQTSNGAIQYTRGGSFEVDKDGRLLTTTGEAVLGWTRTNGVLDTNLAVGSITVPVGTLEPPIKTTSFSFYINLNAAATPETTAQFTKNATSGQWDYGISIPDADVSNPPATPLTGSITFDTSGKLLTPTATDAAPQLQIQGLKDGAADMNINWNLFNGTTPRVSQYAQPSAISAVSQDGAPAAQLISISLGDAGKVLAQYSNGQQIVVGQLAMALVRNPESLIAVGNNNYQLSVRTAVPAVGTSGTGGRGSVVGGAVEASNVDIAQEFTNLIVLQRGFEANSKVITTVDEMSQVTIQLKK
jgi:flagellar hook protein FlgE